MNCLLGLLSVFLNRCGRLSNAQVVLTVAIVVLLGVVGLLRGGYIRGAPNDDTTLPQSFLDAKVFPSHLNGIGPDCLSTQLPASDIMIFLSRQTPK